MPQPLSPQDALIVVDVQNDFFPGGPLGVEGAEHILPVLNGWIDRARQDGATVVLSRDWHPSDHCSFEQRGGPWPLHCVQGSDGAAFHPNLKQPDEALIVSKAHDADHESYSDFGYADVDLRKELRDRGVRRVWIGGLTTEYCIEATAVDAAREGFETYVLVPAIRAVDLNPGDGDAALRRMQEAGAVIEREA